MRSTDYLRAESNTMGRQERSLHKNFVDYQNFIVNHPNYASLPNKLSKSGEITWVKVKDKSRTKWWDELKLKMELPDRASVARAIHPKELKGMKPCQVCGEYLSIHYRYLNESAFKSFTKIYPKLNAKRLSYTVEDLAKIVLQNNNLDFSKFLVHANQKFSDPLSSSEMFGISFNSNLLSPGVMSNAPDRLDGFHTYNACCRSVQDTGRHKTNLARYSQDRRAYENWADGNWRAANRLMGMYASSSAKVNCPGCKKLAKMTADHIGPISLGFSHRMKFKPLCSNCNSSKNNRITFEDVKLLINDEINGEQVISWHSKFIWDGLKRIIKSDEDALKLSVVMRKHLHFVLTIFAIILENNGQDFLKSFLHPEYANFDYEFLEFDPTTGAFKVREFVVQSKNTEKNANRYIRISMDSLIEYSTKENRRILEIENQNVSEMIDVILGQITNHKYSQAENTLRKLIDEVGSDLIKLF